MKTMPSIHPPTDQAIRMRALEPGTSFIVQAPAGSGKTELLTQRYLNLLASACQAPEEIIAITFTRKAANAMRTRIIQRLNQAKRANPTQTQAIQLAQRVLKKDQTNQWGLLKNPNRLRIMTIDALCGHLTQQMPLLSQSNPQATVVANPRALYQLATTELLKGLEEDTPWSHPLTLLAQHLDNNVTRIESLLISMLSKRNQWLRYIPVGISDPLSTLKPTQLDLTQLRQQLESSLQTCLIEKLITCKTHQPLDLLTHLAHLPFLADTFKKPLKAELTDLPRWLSLAQLLLTEKGSLRKTVTKAQGFPAASTASNPSEVEQLKTIKQKMLDWLGILERDYPAFVQSLSELKILPTPHYTPEQWSILTALLNLLPWLAANLSVVFNTHQVTDFSQIAQSAMEALGTSNNPSNLALRLDYQIQHLLIDEFQDTSRLQFQLIEQLIEGWTPNDGRSIFLVGDPMQSIYRFRQAEVGLFLHVQTHGIAQLQPIALTLSNNFRSTATIINWINDTFSQLFPQTNNQEMGAIRYSPSKAFKNPIRLTQSDDDNDPHRLNERSSAIHWHITDTNESQGLRIARLIYEQQQQYPHATIAILAHARSHLSPLLSTLKATGIRYQAVEIEALSEQTVIQDLRTLTQALLQLGNRLAWFALLRAPWCGLNLADLHVLACYTPSENILWDSLCTLKTSASESAVAFKQKISPDGLKRLQRIIPILDQTLASRGRHSIVNWVKGCWIRLGGPACLKDALALENANAYFDLLDRLDHGGDIDDINALDHQLNTLYAPPHPQADDHVQVMTLHKAKGLEFDMVIMSSLSQTTQSDKKPLLRWMERQRQNSQQTDLILAPLHAANTKKDPIYDYLTTLQKTQNLHEKQRLLYVAATRAKQTLHLITTRWKDDEQPPPHSPLRILWPILKDQIKIIKSQQAGENQKDQAWAQNHTNLITLNNNKPLQPKQKQMQETSHAGLTTSLTLRRLNPDWVLPPPTYGEAPRFQTHTQLKTPQAQQYTLSHLELTLSNNQLAIQMGILLHQLLQQISQQGINQWLADTKQMTSAKQQTHWQCQLQAMGLKPDEAVLATQIIQQAITTTCHDPRGRWILDNTHKDAHGEYSFKTVNPDGSITQHIIDRTFIDKTNTRWIIDYKTSHPQDGQPTHEFLEEAAQQHRDQLIRYAENLVKVGTYKKEQTIRLGLYFPRFAGWKEISAKSS